MANLVRRFVSQNRRRYIQEDYNLDLCYVTGNIIAMGFPGEGAQGILRNPRSEIKRFLQNKHKNHYKVYNLCSEREYDPRSLGGHFARFPFDDHQVPNLSLIEDFCEDASKWLQESSENVIAVHCKAGKGRTGLMICSLLLYMGKCATVKEACNLFGDKRSVDNKGVTIPSQMRFIKYYAEILKNRLSLVDFTTVQLRYIRITGLSKTLLDRISFKLLIRQEDSSYDHLNFCSIKSITSSKTKGDMFSCIAPSGKVGMGYFPSNEFFHLIVDDLNLYIIAESDIGNEHLWKFQGDIKFEAHLDGSNYNSCLFFSWINTNFVNTKNGIYFDQKNLDKVLKWLPESLAFEAQFVPPVDLDAEAEYLKTIQNCPSFKEKTIELLKSANKKKYGNDSSPTIGAMEGVIVNFESMH